MDNNEIIYSNILDKSVTKEVIDYIFKEKFDLSFNIYSFYDWIVYKKDERVKYEENYVKAYSVVTIDDIKSSVVHKLLYMCNILYIDSILKALKTKFPNLYIEKSSSMLIEIMEKGINKGEGIKQYIKYKGIDIENTYAFGDNYNNLEMLNVAKHSFIMADGPKELKEKYNTTSSNNEDGIYNKLNELNIIK